MAVFTKKPGSTLFQMLGVIVGLHRCVASEPYLVRTKFTDVGLGAIGVHAFIDMFSGVAYHGRFFQESHRAHGTSERPSFFWQRMHLDVTIDIASSRVQSITFATPPRIIVFIVQSTSGT